MHASFPESQAMWQHESAKGVCCDELVDDYDGSFSMEGLLSPWSV